MGNEKTKNLKEAKEEGLKAAIFAVLRREDHAGLFWGKKDPEGTHGDYSDNTYISICRKSPDGEHHRCSVKKYATIKVFQEYGGETEVTEEYYADECCYCGKAI